MPGKEHRAFRAGLHADAQQSFRNAADRFVPAHRDKGAFPALGAHALHGLGEAVGVVDELLHCRALDAEAALDMRMPLRLHDGTDSVVFYGRVHKTGLTADAADGKLCFCHVSSPAIL